MEKVTEKVTSNAWNTYYSLECKPEHIAMKICELEKLTNGEYEIDVICVVPLKCIKEPYTSSYSIRLVQVMYKYIKK